MPLLKDLYNYLATYKTKWIGSPHMSLGGLAKRCEIYCTPYLVRGCGKRAPVAFSPVVRRSSRNKK